MVSHEASYPYDDGTTYAVVRDGVRFFNTVADDVHDGPDTTGYVREEVQLFSDDDGTTYSTLWSSSLDNQTVLWLQKDGTYIRIADMHQRHRENAARVLLRNRGAGVKDTPLYKALTKGTDMAYRRLVDTNKAVDKASQLDQLALKFAEQALEAQAKADALRAVMETEPTSDDENEAVVIQWQESFGRGGPKYTYVAIKPAHSDYWYTSDASGNKYTWTGLVNRFYSVRHNDYWIANGWDHAGGEE